MPRLAILQEQLAGLATLRSHSQALQSGEMYCRSRSGPCCPVELQDLVQSENFDTLSVVSCLKSALQAYFLDASFPVFLYSIY